MNPSRFLLLGALLAVTAHCTDPVDKAAKKRIFSPEDPPKAIASASEKLRPEDVADHAEVARRILGMGAAETTERIGPHHFTATVTFEWTGAGHVTKLVENRSLRAGPGGVSGDFHGTLDNSRDQGLEVLRVGGQVYARSKYGKFRQRSRDRGIAEREREEIFGSMRDLDDLFRGRLKLSPQGTVSHLGRTAWRYEVALGPPGAAPTAAHLPAPPAPRNGVDSTTQRRLAFYDKRDPVSLSGEVLVDSDTAVVLKAKLDGRITVPGEASGANLHLTLDSALTEVGTDPHLKAPDDALPDQDKPEGIASALDRFGVPHGDKRDAGVSSEPVPDESL